MKTRLKPGRLLVAAATVAIAMTASAEDAYVKLPTAAVRAGTSADYKAVANLKMGDKLQILSREGSWLKVKFGDYEGYIHQNSVSSKDAGGGGGLTATKKTSPADAGLASRGVGDDAGKWAKGNNRNTTGLERMIALRGSLTGGELPKFEADGHVGAAK